MFLINGISLALLSVRIHTVNPFSILTAWTTYQDGYRLTPACLAVSELVQVPPCLQCPIWQICSKKRLSGRDGKSFGQFTEVWNWVIPTHVKVLVGKKYLPSLQSFLLQTLGTPAQLPKFKIRHLNLCSADPWFRPKFY